MTLKADRSPWMTFWECRYAIPDAIWGGGVKGVLVQTDCHRRNSQVVGLGFRVPPQKNFGIPLPTGSGSDQGCESAGFPGRDAKLCKRPRTRGGRRAATRRRTTTWQDWAGRAGGGGADGAGVPARKKSRGPRPYLARGGEHCEGVGAARLEGGAVAEPPLVNSILWEVLFACEFSLLAGWGCVCMGVSFQRSITSLGLHAGRGRCSRHAVVPHLQAAPVAILQYWW
jgi:hypothetical protein